MLNKLISITGVILLVLFLFGCQEQSVTDPVEENSNELNLNKGGVVENVSGSGHILVLDELRVFNHNARRKNNGSVSGHFQLNNHSSGLHISGSVICFKVIGNQAYYGAVIENTNSEDPNFWLVGHYVVWSVVDNGEGNNSGPDQISLITTTGNVWTEADILDWFASNDPGSTLIGGFDITFTLFEVENGNIQLH